MKRSGFLFFLLLSLAAVSVSYFGASMMAQSEDNLLLFTYYDEEAAESRSLYLLNADTGEERFITDLVGYADAGWSPDGRIWVVDNQNERERRLRFLDAETLEESIFEHPLYMDSCEADVHWSPNGEQFAWFSHTGDEFFLNVQNLAEGTSYQLSTERTDAPRWSADSQYLLLDLEYSLQPSQLYAAADGSPLFSPQSFGSFLPNSRYITYRDEDWNGYIYEIATNEIIEIGSASLHWSPEGRYFVTISDESQTLYDTQSEAFQTLDLGYPVGIGGWLADESAVFLRTDYLQYEGFESGHATKLLLYALESQSSTVILENVAWLSGIYRSGDWYAISYSTIPPVDMYDQPNRMLFYDGTTEIDVELALGNAWLWSDVDAVGDGLGLVFHTLDGLYYFDNAAMSLELIAPRHDKQFVSPNGDYIAFISPEEAGAYDNLSLWNRENRSIRIAEQAASTIIGWQGSPQRYSLLYCGIG